MKFKRIKKRTYDCLLLLHKVNSAMPQPEQFKAEIQAMGKPGRYETWVKALADFYTRASLTGCLDAWSLITVTLDFPPGSEFYEFRHEIFEEFIALPDGIEALKMGFEQLLGIPFTREEKEELNRGFFRLVAEQQQRGSTAFPAWRLPILSAA